MFDLIPYTGAGLLRFAMSRVEVIALMGKPRLVLTNRLRQVELRYPNCAVILSSVESRVVEIMFYPTADLRVQDIEVFTDPAAFDKLLGLDGHACLCGDTILLLNLGLAINDFRDSAESCDRQVTAFARGLWDDLKDSFVVLGEKGTF